MAPTDVTDPAAVEALFGARSAGSTCCSTTPGRSGPSQPLEELPLDAWRHVVDTNLTGAFLCAQAAFRLMKEQDPRGGRIINNGSISAHVPRPHSVAYTATKHAITGLTKSISLEGRAYDIACGQIDIGNAATEMTAAMERGVPQADGSIAAEPTMDVRHTAEAVVYMAGLPLDANVAVHDHHGDQDAVHRPRLGPARGHLPQVSRSRPPRRPRRAAARSRPSRRHGRSRPRAPRPRRRR